MSIDRFDSAVVDKLVEDIKEFGLIHPIVIRSPYKDYQTEPNPDISELADDEIKKVFNIFVGNKRVVAATRLGYTHISAYHVKRDEDARMLCGATQIRGFLTNW